MIQSVCTTSCLIALVMIPSGLIPHSRISSAKPPASCTLVNISHRTRERNTAYLDMDGDGIAEEIILEPSQDPENMAYRDETDPLSYFRLQVGNAEMENSLKAGSSSV